MVGIGDMMKQAQQMQEKMQQVQKDIAESEIQAESGAGLVKVVMTGRHDVKSVDIDPSLLTEDKEILEDLIAAAMNDAAKRVEENNKEMMAKVTGGIDLPPGFKMPF
jgi:hypothetical protein